MAAIFYYYYHRRRQLRRNRVFRDRTHPLEVLNDDEIYKNFRFLRQHIFEMADELHDDLHYVLPRKGALPPVLQVCLALRFYATGEFQNAVGEMIGVHQATTSRTISRVTQAFLRRAPLEVRIPATQKEADETKIKFSSMTPGFPNTIGCIGCTHIPIQTPVVAQHEYLNRHNFHSIKVQVVCNADHLFICVTAKWPGSVSDVRVLRKCGLFRAFESPRKPLEGLMLAGSGCMLRDWIMTPVANPANDRQRNYNSAHSSTRATVKQSVSLAKKRFRCLRTALRLDPAKACQVIIVCFMLHNRAMRLRLQPPEDGDEDDEDEDSDRDGEDENSSGQENDMIERARQRAGEAVRHKLIDDFF